MKKLRSSRYSDEDRAIVQQEMDTLVDTLSPGNQQTVSRSTRRNRQGRYAPRNERPVALEVLPDLYTPFPLPEKMVDSQARRGIDISNLYLRYRQLAPGQGYDSQVGKDYFPNTTEELERVMRSTRSDVRAVVALHEFVTADMLETLSLDESEEVRASAASGRKLSLETQWRLARDPSREVRRWLIENHDLAKEIVTELRVDPDFLVRRRARKHPNSPDAIQSEIEGWRISCSPNIVWRIRPGILATR